MGVPTLIQEMQTEVYRLKDKQDKVNQVRVRLFNLLLRTYENDESYKTRTKQRKEWLIKNYATWPGERADVLAEINKMPGNFMPMSAFASWVKDLQLRRSFLNVSAVRDHRGNESIALTDERKSIHTAATCPITFDDAIAWGKRNGLVRTDDDAADFRTVNKTRAEHGLPVFTLIGSKSYSTDLPELKPQEYEDA